MATSTSRISSEPGGELSVIGEGRRRNAHGAPNPTMLAANARVSPPSVSVEQPVRRKPNDTTARPAAPTPAPRSKRNARPAALQFSQADIAVASAAEATV